MRLMALRSQNSTIAARPCANDLTSDGGASDDANDDDAAANPSDAGASADASGAASEPARVGDDRPRLW